MRMLKTRRDLDLTEEAIWPKGRSKLGSQDLHRHLAVVLQILGEVDRGHAARAKLFLDGIAVGEGGFETVEGVGHCVLAPLATVVEYGLWS